MRVPERTCIVCKKMSDKKDFFRIVKTKEGEISFDISGKKNGRGAYICKDKNCFLKLKKVKGLDRSFKMTVPSERYDEFIQEVEKIEEGRNG